MLVESVLAGPTDDSVGRMIFSVSEDDDDVNAFFFGSILFKLGEVITFVGRILKELTAAASSFVLRSFDGEVSLECETSS